jgi:GNAT superfamily N-acetyltransferase
MEIRAIREDEADALGELTVRVYEAIGATDDDYTPILRDVRSRLDACEVLVAIVDGEVAGGVAYVPGPGPWADIAREGEAVFRMLAVHPDHQGKGIGRRLVEECIARATAAGRGGIAILSDPEMSVAHGMYERMGFVRTPDRDVQLSPTLTLMAYVLSIHHPSEW